MHLECWPPAVISFRLCLSFTQITRPPFLHPFTCIPPSTAFPHRSQFKQRERNPWMKLTEITRDWPLPSDHTKQCIMMTYRLRNVYVWIHLNESALNAQKTPQKRTAMLNSVTLILTQDETFSETQADLKTEGTGPRMFNPPPGTPVLIKHTLTNQGLQDCLKMIHFAHPTFLRISISYSVYW